MVYIYNYDVACGERVGLFVVVIIIEKQKTKNKWQKIQKTWTIWCVSCQQNEKQKLHEQLIAIW